VASLDAVHALVDREHVVHELGQPLRLLVVPPDELLAKYRRVVARNLPRRFLLQAQQCGHVAAPSFAVQRPHLREPKSAIDHLEIGVDLPATKLVGDGYG
jgi:hypothetical protein